MKRLIPALAVAAAFAVPTVADAATVKYEGPEGSEILVVVGAPGEKSNMSVQDHSVAGAVTLYDGGSTFKSETPYCKVNTGSVSCPAPNGMRIEFGDGNDTAVVMSGVVEPVHFVGGPGDDSLEGHDSNDVIEGGEGNDRLVAYGGNDLVDGGPGNDKLEGEEGDDRVLGGEGDDLLRPDGYETQGTDVADGGPGIDTIESEWSTRLTGDMEPLLAVTLGGGADDGRPGENDDVTGVERLVMHKGGKFVGTDAAEYVKLHQVGDDGEIVGHGGDDELRGGDGTDKIDGGTGNDKVDGGFGDDTIVGGPGRDQISSDLAGGDCGPLWCKTPWGNDVVEARDGEADSISCGEGQDRVVADLEDTVAADCETVEKPTKQDDVIPPNNDANAACTTTKVRGLTVKKAKKRLARAGCAKRITVRRNANRRVRSGRVVKTIASGDRLVLVVSRGRG